MIKKFHQYNESFRDKMTGISSKEIKEKIKDLDMESQLFFLKKNKIPSDTIFTDKDFEKFIKDYITSYGYDDINYNYSITKYNLPRKYYKNPTIDEIKIARDQLGGADFLEYMKNLGVNLYDTDYYDFDKIIKTMKEKNK